MIIFILLIEFFLLTIISSFGKRVKNLIYYNNAIVKQNYPIVEIAKAKEQRLYFFTIIYSRIPSLSFKPTNWKCAQFKIDKGNAVHTKEKTIYFFLTCLRIIKLLFGDFFIDFVLIITFLFYHQIFNVITIYSWINKFFNQLYQFNFLSYFNDTYSFITKNGSALLIILIFILAIYIKHLKNKSKEFVLEPTWTSEENKKIIQLYRIQKEIEKQLSAIIIPNQNNMNRCQMIIHLIDSYPECNLNISLTENLKDYSQNLKKISELLAEISAIEGFPLFYKHNKNAFLQLQLFGFISYRNIDYFFNFERCNKSSIKRIFKDNNDNQKSRKELMKCWMWGIAIENGIDRYLKYSNKKKNKYLKTIGKIDEVDFLNKIINKSK